jgi:hypothetical protein
MTPAELDAIRARHAAATPGPYSYRPWKSKEDGLIFDDWGTVRAPAKDGESLGCVVANAKAAGAYYDADQHRADKTDPCEANGQFFAHTWSDIQALLERVAELEDEIDRLRAQCGMAARHIAAGCQSEELVISLRAASEGR